MSRSMHATCNMLEATTSRKHFHALLNISSTNKENKGGCNVNKTAQDENLAPHRIIANFPLKCKKYRVKLCKQLELL